jgi:isopentenyl diphosphate isomerase/L-lactate dehydrogenase-like FMN-dependent dehydrogenase
MWRCPWPFPTGMTGMQHADGEILARAAKKFGIPFTVHHEHLLY